MLAFVDAQDSVKARPGRRPRLLHERALRARRRRALSRPLAAAASFYGTWLVSDAVESPHLSLGKIKGEVYIACAEHDSWRRCRWWRSCATCSSKRAAPASSSSTPASTRLRLSQRKVYDKPAAERHWERLIALYRRRLG